MQLAQKDVAKPVGCLEVMPAMAEKTELRVELPILYQLDFGKLRQQFGNMLPDHVLPRIAKKNFAGLAAIANYACFVQDQRRRILPCSARRRTIFVRGNTAAGRFHDAFPSFRVCAIPCSLRIDREEDDRPGKIMFAQGYGNISIKIYMCRCLLPAPRFRRFRQLYQVTNPRAGARPCRLAPSEDIALREFVPKHRYGLAIPGKPTSPASGNCTDHPIGVPGWHRTAEQSDNLLRSLPAGNCIAQTKPDRTANV